MGRSIRCYRWLVTGLLVCITAQGVVAQPKRERRTFARLMELRSELLRECRGASEATRKSVAAAMAEPTQGNPLRPLWASFGAVRGIDVDDEFRVRLGLQCFAMPEVVDGDQFDAVHITVHLPYSVELPGETVFQLRIVDARGDTRWNGVIFENTELEDLLRFRAVVSAPIGDLEDGTYEVHVETYFEGVGPRPGDVALSAVFHIDRGFLVRLQRLDDLVQSIEGANSRDLAILEGALAQVQRVYVGEPPQGRGRALVDLELAEKMAANLEAGRSALAEVVGWATIGVALEHDVVSVRMRMSPPSEQSRPLVLFVPGAPSVDPQWSRLTSPDATAPGWLSDALDDIGFDAEGRYQLAVLESPGRMKSPRESMVNVVRELQAGFGLDGRTVLVAEREGAVVVTSALAVQPDLAVGVCLVNGGMMSPNTAKELRDLRLLVIPSHAYPANVNLERIEKLVRDAGGAVRALAAEACPWSIAVELSLPDIEEFLREVLGRE